MKIHTYLQEAGRAESAFARYDVATVLKKFYSIEIDDVSAPPGVEIIDFLERRLPRHFLGSARKNWASMLRSFTSLGSLDPSTTTACGRRNFLTLYPILVSCYCLTHTVVCDLVVRCGNCRNWRLLAPWNEAKITVPVKFIAGDKDIGVQSFGVEKYIKSGEFKSTVPDLEVAVIEGHHFLQQEQAERVNSEIISYLVRFTSQEASS